MSPRTMQYTDAPPAWESARELAEALACDGTRVSRTLPDGRVVHVRWQPDDEPTTLEEHGDFHGRVQYVEERRGRKRPDGMDGGARIVHRERSGVYWWQPPADLTAEQRESLRRYVTGFLDGSWCFSGVLLSLDSAPCAHCGQTTQGERASLWGVESNASVDWLTEILGDLLAEAGVTP